MDSSKFSESVYLDYNIIYGLTEGTVKANDVYSCIGKEIGVAFSIGPLRVLFQNSPYGH